MSHTTLLVNAATTIIGMVMLGMMAYGTWQFGFAALFSSPVRRVVMVLGW